MAWERALVWSWLEVGMWPGNTNRTHHSVHSKGQLHSYTWKSIPKWLQGSEIEPPTLAQSRALRVLIISMMAETPIYVFLIQTDYVKISILTWTVYMCLCFLYHLLNTKLACKCPCKQKLLNWPNFLLTSSKSKILREKKNPSCPNRLSNLATCPVCWLKG